MFSDCGGWIILSILACYFFLKSLWIAHRYGLKNSRIYVFSYSRLIIFLDVEGGVDECCICSWN